jgi:hypothetical protein
MTEQGCAKQSVADCFFACTPAVSYTLHEPLVVRKYYIFAVLPLLIHDYPKPKLPGFWVAVGSLLNRSELLPSRDWHSNPDHKTLFYCH